MSRLDYLEEASSLALEFAYLVAIAAYSVSPSTAYKVARSLHWYEDKAQSCRSLAVILRDYGVDTFRQIVQGCVQMDQRCEVNCEDICLCECHLQQWDLASFSEQDILAGDCDCHVMPHSCCFHAAHVFGGYCKICDWYVDDDEDFIEGEESDEYENYNKDSQRDGPKKDIQLILPAQRVERIAQKLQKVSGTSYSVTIIEDNQKQAYADGKDVYITSGMIKALEDDELAWVVGHEIFHNKEEHSKKKEERWKKLVQRTADLSSLPKKPFMKFVVGAIVGVNGYLNNIQEDQREEFEADQEGKIIVKEAGYDSQKSQQVLPKIERGRLHPGGMLSSHPPTRDRIQNLKDKS